ncbi:probable GTPase Rho1 [Serendipita indica DSM 11827]|uniref:Probable GTPase Rho1 n=1 Tax=Serendipita indica (strain DSM 11827) TaxID=1109443 RepID=G4TYH2_SERID|nr:probable GTPase Rho1 [Serendipita indica DSM 11827]
MTNPVQKKLVFIGDSGVGKSRLIIRIQHGEYHDQFLPAFCGGYWHDTDVDRRPVELQLWDTASQEDYDRLRPLSYPETDVCVLCFAIDSVTSLQNVRDKWVPEFLHFRTKLDAPFLLVGCKGDLRHDAVGASVEQIESIRQAIGAIKYVECSAKI